MGLHGAPGGNPWQSEPVLADVIIRRGSAEIKAWADGFEAAIEAIKKYDDPVVGLQVVSAALCLMKRT